MKEEVCVLWPTYSLPRVPQEAGMGPGLRAVCTVSVPCPGREWLSPGSCGDNPG